MRQGTAKSTWERGQRAIGVYCGKHFDGVINENTRATPDGRNVIFGVTLDNPITIYGKTRNRVEVWTNSTDVIYLG